MNTQFYQTPEFLQQVAFVTVAIIVIALAIGYQFKDKTSSRH